jgi:predicted dehydrogenase
MSDKLSRRGFLEQSLITAAAGIAGIASSGSAYAAHNEIVEKQSKSANEKIHIAVIGLNGRGGSHLDAYLNRDDVEVVALCDVDLGVVERASERVKKKGRTAPAGYQDIRKLLELKGLDAVSIATPNHWHSLAAIWALQSGKDVYVEKPVSHNVHEGRVLVDTARKYNRICQAGTQSRSSKACQDAAEYIHSGHIGKVLLSRGLCYKPRNTIGKISSPTPVPDGVDYDLWLGPAPQKPINRQRFHYDWHWFWDYGNGDLGNQGIHQMDIARWALNKNHLPSSVFSLGGRFGYVDDGETPNTELSFFDYGDSHLIFEVRGLKTADLKGAKVGNIVYGTEGYVVITDNYGKAAAFDNQDRPVQTFEGGGDHFGNFLSALRSRKRGDLNGEIEKGHLSSALCHLGNISYRLGAKHSFADDPKSLDKDQKETFARFKSHLNDNEVDLKTTQYALGPVLKIDAKRERFKDSAEANQLITREYRAGFVVPDKA